MALNDHVYNRIQPQISRIDGRIDTISNRVGTLETITNITHVTEIINSVISADLSTKADVDHKHVTSDITDFQASLDDKANISDIEKLDKKLDSKSNIDHSHSIDDVNGLKNKLEEKAEISVVANLSEIVSRKANSNHIHSISDVEGLSTKIKSLEDGISGKADTGHNHEIDDIIDLSYTISSINSSISSLNSGKADVGHKHVSSEITDLNDTISAGLSPYAKTNDINTALNNYLTKSSAANTYETIENVTSKLENKLTAPLSSTPSVKSCKAIYNSADSSAYKLHFDITFTFTDSSYIACFNTSVSDKSIFTLSFNYTQSSSSSTYTTTLYIRSTTNDAYEIYTNETDNITIAGYTINPGTLKFNLIFSISSDTSITYNNISSFTYNDTIFTTYRKFDGILLADNISPNINERINNKADKSHQHFTKDVVGLPEVLSAVSWTGHTHTISDVDGLNTKLDEMKLEIISAIYPVGSVYYSVNNASPATLFGIGTWQHLPSSKYTRIADSSSDVSSISTGGSDNITVNNLPAHYHTTTTYDCIGSDDINSDSIVHLQQDMNKWIKEDVATVMGGTLSGTGVTIKTIVHSGTEQGAYEIGVTYSEKAPTSETWINHWSESPNPGICYGRYQIPTGLAGNSDAFYPSYIELHAWVRTA